MTINYTAENTGTDELWVAAGIEVNGERNNWGTVSNTDCEIYKAIMNVVRENAELECEYYGILECAFEN